MRGLLLPKGAGKLWCSGGRRLLGIQAEAYSHREVDEGRGFEDITRSNFWHALGPFKAQLESADFLALDLELSGVHCSGPISSSFHSSDSHQERCYSRLKHLAEKFAVLQVGVSLFQQLVPASNKYIAYPYNFYVFPRNELAFNILAPTFSCEASSLEFLASHGFNFNLCIQGGISYLSKAQEEEARTSFASDFFPPRNLQSNGRVISSTSDIIFSERVRVEIAKWQRRLKGSIDDTECLRCPGYVCMFTETRGFEIKVPEMCNNTSTVSNPYFILQLESHHQVCLSQQVLEMHFEDLVPIVKSTCTLDTCHEITIFLAKTKEDITLIKKQNDHAKEVFINEAVGFRHVIDAIVSSKKLVVGHNCALDFTHIHSKFISPLPSTFEEFSSSLLAHFPFLIDTKHLVRAEPKVRATWSRKYTSLNGIYIDLCKPKEVKHGGMRYARTMDKRAQMVHIEIMPGFKRYQDADVQLQHEAGYDAFITGCVFAQICHRLDINMKRLAAPCLSKDEIADYMNILCVKNVLLNLKAGRLEDAGIGSSGKDLALI